MQMRGKVWKDGKFWVIDLPVIGRSTQGFSKKEALYMITDLVKTMLDDPDYEVEAMAEGKDGFVLTVKDPMPLFAFLIKELRAMNGISIAEMARRLGGSSRNNVAQYETGKHEPGLRKFQDMLRVFGCDLEIVPASARPRMDLPMSAEPPRVKKVAKKSA